MLAQQQTALQWTHENPQMWAWMQSHWDDMTWMHQHWQGMTWMHGAVMNGGPASGGMMGN